MLKIDADYESSPLNKIAFSAIAIPVLGILVACADAYVTDAEEYLKKDISVQKSVGDVISLTRTNTIILRPGDTTPGYREYQFIVCGSTRKALVSVLVENLDASSKGTYSIKSIEHL